MSEDLVVSITFITDGIDDIYICKYIYSFIYSSSVLGLAVVNHD